MVKKSTNKIVRLVGYELFFGLICAGVIWFKVTTNNIFFPEVKLLVVISLIGLSYLGLGIWFDKI